MAGKEKSVASVTASDSVESQPWEHGDKNVIYIHPYWWETFTVDEKAILNDNFRVMVTEEIPEPEPEE